MEVSGKLHASVALTLGETPTIYHWMESCVGLSAVQGSRVERKNLTVRSQISLNIDTHVEVFSR